MGEVYKNPYYEVTTHMRSASFLVFLTALSVSGPLSINFFLALLPAMADDFSTNAATIQLTVSVYLIGFAGAQLVIGPLSDKFGRKPVLVYCYALFSLASLVCVFSTSAELLIAARFIQSIGGCAGVLISRAIVRDVYSPKDMGKVMSYMITGFSMAPLIAPAIGGFLGVHFGWRSLFIVFTVLGGGLMLWTLLGFEETNTKRNPHAFNLKALFINYASLLLNKHFFGYFTVVSTSVAGVLTYTSASSFVLIEVLEVPAQYYGVLFSITAFGMFIGSIISAKLSGRYSSEIAAKNGVIFLFIGGLLMATLPLIGIVSITSIVGSMFIYAVGNGIVMPSAMSLAIMPFPKKTGAAAALIGFAQGALGALCGYIAGQLYNGTVIPMALTIGILAVIACLGLLFSQSIKPQTST
ncbi:DHA1 family bicyclomycin/chloramphenicol resistance-like MFS transporter [Reinekea marinisedimentorum]|uniref:Bcr/CflA family efflux transporter n=2 Tax=Reinekea marinisedimentorum TaxID=230495 RepID=A0A4R3HYG6_9GAMM|nr:DHA1 family bicyclomycin/chloramphenicol resistance-like MFS transporter [Reinekea marinisedimentorum]